MRFNIQYKIIVLISFLIALLLVGINIYLNKHFTDYTYQRIRHNLIQDLKLANTLVLSLNMEQRHSDRLDQLADRIGEDLQVRATIIAKDGTVLGDSSLTQEEVGRIENHLYRPEVQTALKNKLGESRRFSTTTKEDMLYIAQTFGHESVEGFLRLAIPLSEIEQVTGNLRRFLALAFVIAFIVSVTIGSLAAMFLTKPIKEMSVITKHIAHGNFSQKVYIRSNDEIGDLAESINYMSDQIKTRIDEVTRSKSRLEAVLLSMFEGMMVVNEEGRILLMNQRLRDFLRVTQEPLGRKPLEIIRNIEIQDLTDKVLSLEKGVESKELVVHLPEERTLQIHATPVIRDGKTEGAVLVFHDITELRRLEKVRQDFVANVSHELRTPLTSIKGYAETLLEGAIDDKANARDFLEIIYTDAGRLSNLVNDLLDLSRIESGKAEFDIKPVALDPIVERVITALSNQAKTKAIEIRKDLPKQLPKVLMDDTAIAQVLLNLVDNAIKYNKISGSVLISAKDEGHSVKVFVQDTGIGIPQEDLPRIFERFYRVDKARSRELGGTGLGLSIVKHIVSAHQGDVFVESTPGRGSTLSFTLPTA
ncbi:MAG TPA: ATP-binding protein [Candidatus Omnitrophota bacterium]|nr:ATP-binding protein [Candidatus Omnitrophota bacterium]